MELAPSEVVVVHPLRFVDPSRGRGPAQLVRPHRAQLERVVVMATAVACIVRDEIKLDVVASRLGFLSFGPQRLQLRATGHTPTWPVESLESRLCSIAQCDPQGIPLTLALRRLLGSRVLRSAVAVVEAGLQARSAGGLDQLRNPQAARDVQDMLADFREAHPRRWTQLQATADRALRPGLHAVESSTPLPHPRDPDRDRRRRDYLSGWKRLNPQPPSARAPKKGKLDD